jgi:hypothetical protein
MTREPTHEWEDEKAASTRDPASVRETGAEAPEGPYRGIGPRGYRRSDTGIRDDISERLTENDRIDASDIEVEVLAGDVTLRGGVPTENERNSAEKVALLVRGVRNVVNRLQVRGDVTRPEREKAAQAPPGRPPEAPAEARTERRTQKVGSANIAVFGIYRDRAEAENGVDALKTAGFRDTDISMVSPVNPGTKDLAFDKATKAPEGVMIGAGSGLVVGGILGWLASMGMLAVPGAGALVAAGPVVSILAGMGLVGALGWIVGALVGIGMPEYEAKRHEGRVKRGHVLISVHADDRSWAGRAQKIIDRTGGEDISRTGEKSADFGASDRPMARGQEYREE